VACVCGLDIQQLSRDRACPCPQVPWKVVLLSAHPSFGRISYTGHNLIPARTRSLNENRRSDTPTILHLTTTSLRIVRRDQNRPSFNVWLSTFNITTDRRIQRATIGAYTSHWPLSHHRSILFTNVSRCHGISSCLPLLFTDMSVIASSRLVAFQLAISTRILRTSSIQKLQVGHSRPSNPSPSSANPTLSCASLFCLILCHHSDPRLAYQENPD
jgi:hypothetical protein